MANLHIKTGDTVAILSGDDKGVTGEVIAVSPSEGKVIVKGVNIIQRSNCQHLLDHRKSKTVPEKHLFLLY